MSWFGWCMKRLERELADSYKPLTRDEIRQANLEARQTGRTFSNTKSTTREVLPLPLDEMSLTIRKSNHGIEIGRVYVTGDGHLGIRYSGGHEPNLSCIGSYLKSPPTIRLDPFS